MKAELTTENGNGDSTFQASQRPLHIAARDEDEKSLRKLLITGDIEQRDEKGWTPLHHAAFNGHASTIDLLLQKGAFVDAEDGSARSPLMLAASQGHEKAVERLLQCGANANLSTSSSMSPLNQALLKDHLGAAKFLLDAGASHTGRDRCGFAPLFVACSRSIQTVNLLIDAKADVTEDLVGRITALHLASHSGNVPLLERLLELNLSVDLPERGKDNGYSPLARAIDAQQEEAVSLLLARGANPNYKMATTWTCMLKAAAIGNFKIAEMLVRHELPKADLHAVCKPEGWTALHVACQNGHSQVADLLLRSGWDVNARDKNEATPLHLAAKNRHVDVVQMLLTSGKQSDINVNVPWDPELWTPLHIACQGGNLPIVKQLVGAGASIIAGDFNGNTPLALAKAADHEEVVTFLRDQENQMPRHQSSDSD